MTVSTVVGLIVILFILSIILGAFLYIRGKAKSVSKEVFGTDDLSQIAASMRDQASNTPKSVSGMTSILLPQITRDFPEFQFEEMRSNANNVLTSYLNAVSTGKTTLAKVGLELQDQLRNQVEANDAQGLREHFDDIRIHRTEISQYKKAAGRCVVTFQSAVGYYHYFTDSENTVKKGSKEYHYQTRYNLELEYIQDQTLVENTNETGIGFHCPNCGAPLASLGTKICTYCGSGVTEINLKAWTFCHLEERN